MTIFMVLRNLEYFIVVVHDPSRFILLIIKICLEFHFKLFLMCNILTYDLFAWNISYRGLFTWGKFVAEIFATVPFISGHFAEIHTFMTETTFFTCVELILSSKNLCNKSAMCEYILVLQINNLLKVIVQNFLKYQNHLINNKSSLSCNNHITTGFVSSMLLYFVAMLIAYYIHFMTKCLMF